jgi:hypothetical protein
MLRDFVRARQLVTKQGVFEEDALLWSNGLATVNLAGFCAALSP